MKYACKFKMIRVPNWHKNVDAKLEALLKIRGFSANICTKSSSSTIYSCRSSFITDEQLESMSTK